MVKVWQHFNCCLDMVLIHSSQGYVSPQYPKSNYRQNVIRDNIFHHELTFVYFNFDFNSDQWCLINNNVCGANITDMVKPMYKCMTGNVYFRQNRLLFDLIFLQYIISTAAHKLILLFSKNCLFVDVLSFGKNPWIFPTYTTTYI